MREKRRQEKEVNYAYGEALRQEIEKKRSESRLAKLNLMDDGERELNRSVLEQIAQEKDKLISEIRDKERRVSPIKGGKKLLAVPGEGHGEHLNLKAGKTPALHIQQI